MRRALRLLILGLCILDASPAYANAGIPMLFVTFPGMVMTLAPIIAIETVVFHRRSGISLRRSVRITGCANIASTFIGVPMAWVVLVMYVTDGGRVYGSDTFLQKFLAVTWQAAWLIPYEKDLYWTVPAAFLTLLMPFFAASWFVEYRIAKLMCEQRSSSFLRMDVFWMNVASYSLLACGVITWLLYAVLSPHP